MGAPKISAGQREEILALYRAGVPVDDIAEKFGVHRSYAGNLARLAGLPIRPRGGVLPWTPAIRARMIALAKDGKSGAEIAELLGPPFTKSAVNSRLNRLGLIRGPTWTRRGHSAEQADTVFVPNRNAAGAGSSAPIAVSVAKVDIPIRINPLAAAIIAAPRRPETARKALLDLGPIFGEERECRYPLDERNEVGERLFCGKPVDPTAHRPYCPDCYPRLLSPEKAGRDGKGPSRFVFSAARVPA